jgi:hypothetical protein
MVRRAWRPAQPDPGNPRGYLEAMGKGKVGKAVIVIGASAKLAVKYGPQAKIAWDKGGKQAAAAATQRAKSLTSRRKAFAHAATVVDGSVLKVAPGGTTAYVVFSGEQPIATYPHQDAPYPALLAHVDLGRRVPAEKASRQLGRGSTTRD